MTNRDFHIDLLRVIAIIFVVTIHVTDDLINRINYFGGLSWWYSNILNSFSRIAVPIFIMISGYLILASDYRISDKKRYLIKRLKRVGLPLLFWGVFYTIWHISWFKEPISLTDIFYSILSTKIYHLYFLFIIIELYLLVPTIKGYLTKTKKSSLGKMAFVFLFASVFFNLLAYFLKMTFLVNNIFLISLFYLGYFLFGGYMRLNSTKSKKSVYFAFPSLLILTFLTSFVTFLNMKVFHTKGNLLFWSEKSGQYFYDNLSINVAIMSLLYFFLMIKVVKKHLKKFYLQKTITTLSKFSFGVYLVHVFVIDLINHYGNFDIHQLLSPLWFYISIKIVLAVVTSYLLVYLLASIPFLKRTVGE